MLELRHIYKTYSVGNIETKALEDMTVSFREKEFVSVLGVSGSGKTTFLNIIGGLDRSDSGELIIKGRSTRDFKDSDWDAYRNNSIGFVFQNYNLISHLSIVANVEIAMSLSGVSKAEKHRRSLKILDQVGLKEHLHKKPTQLSGGQMQRVAIARALVNDPEVLLCDEPTGALDSTTSVQILDLIREIAGERLVIMVTHNAALAEKYSDRIIKFEDGRIISDSKPYVPENDTFEKSFSLKKTSMGFFTALNLSFNNIMTKKGRTFLTSLASSIGIIGIALILSLSNGFQKQIDKFQSEAMAEFPILITPSAMEVDVETMKQRRKELQGEYLGTSEFAQSDEVFLYDPSESIRSHKNVFTQEYLDYLAKIDPAICESIGYSRIVGMNLLREVDGEIIPVSLSADSAGRPGGSNAYAGMSNVGLSSYPEKLGKDRQSYLQQYYDVLSGEYPKDETELVLVVDTKNRMDKKVIEALGFETEGRESIKFSEIVGTEMKLIFNDDYYIKSDLGNFIPGKDYGKMYEADKSLTLKISAIVRQKKDDELAILKNGVAYSDKLTSVIIGGNMESEIVKAQSESSRNVITMQEFDEAGKKSMLSYLGGDSIPYMIMIYPTSFENKDAVTAYLDDYNDSKQETEDKVYYTDLAETIANMTKGIMDGITVVLIAFAATSLVVSLIMIGIITYTSVLERTKEIGILKALGARKKDITRVFDAETFIIGIFSGALGIGIARLLIFPANRIIYRLTDLQSVAEMELSHIAALVAVSTVLTVLGGHIPAKMASKKDAVEALRSE